MNRKLQIRNSTAEFLTFASQNESNSIEVRFEDETLWLTQQLIAELFQTSIPNISMHIKSIYEDKELEAGATLKNFLTVRQEGSRQVNRNLEYYNLDMIIAVGYRGVGEPSILRIPQPLDYSPKRSERYCQKVNPRQPEASAIQIACSIYSGSAFR